MEEKETDMIRRAREFAVAAHGAQLYGKRPYVYHLDRTLEVLRWMQVGSPEAQAAALLHDVIEDTATNYSDVKRDFGTTVADLVYAVTDELGKNRQERHALTYPKIARAGHLAIAVKLADRIANVEDAVKSGAPDMDVPDKLAMYRKEQAEFHAALYNHGGHERAWAYLAYILVGGDLRPGA